MERCENRSQMTDKYKTGIMHDGKVWIRLCTMERCKPGCTPCKRAKQALYAMERYILGQYKTMERDKNRSCAWQISKCKTGLLHGMVKGHYPGLACFVLIHHTQDLFLSWFADLFFPWCTSPPQVPFYHVFVLLHGIQGLFCTFPWHTNFFFCIIPWSVHRVHKQASYASTYLST